MEQGGVEGWRWRGGGGVEGEEGEERWRGRKGEER